MVIVGKTDSLAVQTVSTNNFARWSEAFGLVTMSVVRTNEATVDDRHGHQSSSPRLILIYFSP